MPSFMSAWMALKVAAGTLRATTLYRVSGVSMALM
jgi:hypothetical protein